MLNGRIIKGVGGLYFITTGQRIFKCNARGILRKNKIMPTIGDYVKISVISDETGIIEEIFERKNILLRPRVSNIDCAVITFSILSPDINMDLLDRFLILAESQNIENVIICINKCDLVNENQLNEIFKIYSDIYNIIFISAFDETSINNLKKLIDKKVTVFAGPSGVGKSSIINNILPEAILKTGEVSKKIERGRHTTRQVELLAAWENTYIVDSPGFTSLKLDFIKVEDLSYYFKEFKKYLGNCKFVDCKHLHEPDCAIKQQVGNTISVQRYERYVKLINELLERY